MSEPEKTKYLVKITGSFLVEETDRHTVFANSEEEAINIAKETFSDDHNITDDSDLEYGSITATKEQE